MLRSARLHTPILGAIADDITGASDLADALVRSGLTTVQVFGIPNDLTHLPECDAVVVALKTRTSPSADAVAQSLAVSRWIHGLGVERTFFKYCSTFDSTPAGNIGPVADALLSEHGPAPMLVHCPAYPVNGRRLYGGYLFVGDVLLSESGMEKHPLTPMTDANLVRVLARQTSASVGLLSFPNVRRGTGDVAACLGELAEAGVRHVLADAIDNDDIAVIARATVEHPIAAGAAAFGAAWGAALDPARALTPSPRPTAPVGHAAILVGSASSATAAQVADFASRRPVLRLDPDTIAAGSQGIAKVLRWAQTHIPDGPIMIAADSSDDGIRATRDRLGEQASELVEATLATLAVGLHELDVRRLVVAGGETSGAVAAALNLTYVRVGPQICPGVPWTISTDPDLAVAFKSGNFGGPKLFTDAFASFDTDAWEQGR